ncbi:MAG: hypothetical protein Q9182_006079 [Xanthomendoza sp. 2 TL-2023]
MGSDTSHYVNASTQTDRPISQPTQPTDHEDVQDDCGSHPDDFDGGNTPFQSHGQDTNGCREPSVQAIEGGRDREIAPEIFDGPSRIVVSNHNDKSYMAILARKEINKDLGDISEWNDKLDDYTLRFEEADHKVNRARLYVDYCESLLQYAKSQDESDRLREDIAQHRSTLPENEQCRDDLEQKVARLRDTVAYMKALFVETCQKILTEGGLLDLKDERMGEEEIEMEDGTNEWAKPLKRDQYPVHQSKYSSVSIDELARRAANEEVRQRHAELVNIEHQFDTRRERYVYKHRQIHQTVREGTCHMTQTEFDHSDSQTTREMTIDLREAEAKYEEALARRNKLGPNEDDQESGFIDDEYDGYPLSWEDDGIVSAPIARIKKWLESIPEVEDPPLEVVDSFVLEQSDQQGLDDCDICSAGTSDTWSCQDWSRNRKRIDRWREIAGRAR